MSGKGKSRPRGFIERHGLWTGEQEAAAENVRRRVIAEGLDIVRLAWPDQHGLLRGKFLTRDSVKGALVDGMEITMAPFFFDTANGIVFNPFTAGGGFDMPELSGSPNVFMVPDPTTFVVLPWAEKTGWMMADLYFRDGTPFPFSPRNIMRRALADLEEAGYGFVAGLEMEWYLTRIVDDRSAQAGHGGPGSPAPPPDVVPVARGYNYLLENHLDEIEDVLVPLRRHLFDLGLPVRSIDDEWAPSQVETTFDVMTGLRAADATALYRNATKQVCRRLGYLATFMCKPAITGFYASGWHLHTSLTDLATGKNAFIPKDDSEVLSQVGRQWVAGTLEHAAASSVFATPTVNGYRRRRPFSLAPSRATWGFDNRGAMMRVLSAGPDDKASHVENRIGEPAANPYLYMASQALAGLDGIRRGLDPGPLSDEPYVEETRPLLPDTLDDAVDALHKSDFYRAQLGDSFVEYLSTMKRAELDRYHAHVRAQDNPAEYVQDVTEWEHREYFELF
jgi:glutamine synthetase